MNKLHYEVTAQTALDRLFELTATLGDAMERGLVERGLTRSRAEVIWRLAEHEGPLTQRHLSQELRCTPRNVTGLLDALQAAGLVARGPHPTDRRATLVSLTEKGAALAAELDADRRQGADHLLAGIPGTDLASLVTTVELILQRLRDQP